MEKQFECVRLHFKSPLHISRGRDQYDESLKLIHSDSLIASIFVSALRLGMCEDEILSLIDSFRMTSAFPFFGDELFFPKPMVRLPFVIRGTAEEKAGKLYKNIRYLGKSWFEKILAGEESEIVTEIHLKKKGFLSDSLKDSVFMTEVVQRVNVPPDGHEPPTPFYTERVFFNEGAGLFFLIDWENEKHKDIFYKALSILGDFGVGTDRSVGNGFFHAEISSTILRLPSTFNHLCSLGLYLPTKEELVETDLNVSAWSLVKRGGYISGASNPDYTSLRKRSIYMFEEGAVFANKSLVGKRVDLAPSFDGIHSVWREGRPIFVPIHK